MNQEDRKVGVLLLNLGGPDSLAAVRPFLSNLFSDREIIRLGPPFMQKPLAYLISFLRHKKTEGYYRLIGGKSPILDITAAQAQALEQALNGPPLASKGPRPFKVYVGMRYWHPLIEEVLPLIHQDGVRKLVVLGLYPHYSVATTGSSFSMLKRSIDEFPIEWHGIDSWYDNALYIGALVDKIKKGLELFGGADPGPYVLFSAHSLPRKFIEEGDPYVDQIKATIRKVSERMDIKWDLSYQSKSGPVEWLEPSTDSALAKLAGRGVRDLLVVPISFVSDHIETLYEIDILYKGMAAARGIRLERAESLNASPLFIEALKDIVLRGLEEAGWAA
jgi:ferrochelatase